MGSFKRTLNNNKSNVNSLLAVEAPDPDLHVSQSNTDKQLLNMTNALASLADSKNRWRKGDMSKSD